MIDHSLIEKYHAAARRERSEHVHCLLIRAKNWLLDLFAGAGGALQPKPCC